MENDRRDQDQEVKGEGDGDERSPQEPREDAPAGADSPGEPGFSGGVPSGDEGAP
jgi:hypothetical protein